MKERFSWKPGYRGRTVFRIFNGIILGLIVVAMLVPILKIIVDSIDKNTNYGINLWPTNPSLDAYITIISNPELYGPFWISVYTTVVGTLFGLFICTLGAYIIIQKKLIGRSFFSKFIFITMIFDGGLVPTFLVLKSIGFTNTLWAVILPAAINVYNMVLMKNFFNQIPESLFEAADIDGCTAMGTFFRVVLPLAKPALASIGLFFAVSYWNEFFAYVMYISDKSLYNFQVKLREIVLLDASVMDGSVVGYGNMVKNSVTIVAMLPFLVLYPFCQRFFISGVTMGAVKE